MSTRIFRAALEIHPRLAAFVVALGALGTPLIHAGATSGTALVRHGPSLNGTVDGSIQQMLPESVTLNGGAIVTGDLFVPGLPAVRVNGKPAFLGTIDLDGVATPSNHQITLNGGASLAHVVRRVEPTPLATVTAPALPTGTRFVTVTVPAQAVGPWSTLRNLTLNGGVGDIAVPPGTYGEFTANGGTSFTLGVAGATQPSAYNFQRINLNGQAQIRVIGPVVLTVAYGFSGNGIIGAGAHPDLLTLNVYSGGLTLNGGCNVYGFVNAPTGTVIVDGNSQLIGGVTCDRLVVNGGGLLRLRQPVSSNQQPVAHPQSRSVDEDCDLNLVVTGSDPEGGSLTFSLLTGPSHGRLLVDGTVVSSYPYTLGASPSVVYRPEGDYDRTDAFSFTVNDGQQESAPATVSITVNPVNDTPEADPKSVPTREDETVSIPLSGLDVEGSPLTFFIATQPGRGTLGPVGTDGAVLYTPNTDENGTDTFSYVTSDGALTSFPAEVTILIERVNDAPTAMSRSVVTKEDTDKSLLLEGRDIDSASLQFEIVSLPVHGQLSGDLPDIVYHPDPNYDQTDAFTFRVFDGALYSEPGTISITISSENDEPRADAGSLSLDEDAIAPLQLVGTDPEGDPLTFTVTEAPAHGDLLVAGAPLPGYPATGLTSDALSYRPAPNFNGPDQFTFMANDGQVDSEAVVFSLSVIPVNDAPRGNMLSVDTDEDNSADVWLTGFDVEGSPLTFVITQSPVHGLLEGDAPYLTYVPSPDFNGTDELHFTANDGDLDSPQVVVPIVVHPVNDAPEAVADSISTDEDLPLDLVLTGTDIDNAPSDLSFEITVPPQHGELTPTSTSTFTYISAADFTGNDSFEFRVLDQLAWSAPARFDLTVNPVNDAPVAADGVVVTDRNVHVNLTLGASDVDGDALTYVVVAAPGHGTLLAQAPGSPNFEYTPTYNFVGTDSFAFRAADSETNSNVATVTIEVRGTNRPPTASASPLIADEDVPTPVGLTAVDPDSDALTYTINQPTHGTVTGLAPNLVYTSYENYSGPDSFSFKVNDGQLDSDLVEVPVTVNPVNDRPRATTGSATTPEDTDLRIQLLGDDAEGSLLTFAIVQDPVHGSLSPLGGGSFTYHPFENQNGPDSLQFTVSDGELTSEPATFSIEILPVNDQPVAESRSGAIAEDVAFVFTLSGRDIEGSPLVYTITGLPTNGTVDQLTGGPTFTYVPNKDFNGSDSVTFVASDGELESESASFAITVVPVNDPPVALPLVVDVTSDTSVEFALTGYDADGTPLTYTVTQPPSHGTLSGVAPRFTYTSEKGYIGPDAFLFVASDGESVSIPARVDLEIRAPVNSAPKVEAGSDQHLVLGGDLRMGSGGNVVVNNDEWTLSDRAYAETGWTRRFAENLVDAFGPHDAQPKHFLAMKGYDAHCFGGAQFRASIEGRGHVLSLVSPAALDIGNLSSYAGIFIPAHIFAFRSDLEGALVRYVAAGGNLYVTGGSGSGPDAAASRTFLARFGFSFEDSTNQVSGLFQTVSGHKLTENTHVLFSENGNNIELTGAFRDQISILSVNGTAVLTAIFSAHGSGEIQLAGDVQDDGFPVGGELASHWQLISGPASVVFHDAMSPATSAFLSQPGQYELELVASDGELAATDRMQVHLERNLRPMVSAGTDFLVDGNAREAVLHGFVDDDGLPGDAPAATVWALESGPGEPLFDDPHRVDSRVTFPTDGLYLLRLTANDGMFSASDLVEVRVGGLYAYAPRNDLVAWWPGNGFEHDVVFGWSPLPRAGGGYVPGIVGLAQTFRGPDDVIVFPADTRSNVGAGGGMTIECWARFDANRRSTLVSWRNGAAVEIYDRALRIEFTDTNGERRHLDTGKPLNLGEWYHVAVTYDRASGAAEIFVNGDRIAKSVLGGFSPRTNTDLIFGDGGAFAEAPLHGALDEVAIYSTALSAAVIRAHYLAREVGLPPFSDGTPPRVHAGYDQSIETAPAWVSLNGLVSGSDEGRLQSSWSVLDGPGTVDFSNSQAPQTQAAFTEPGLYLLQLTATEGMYRATDTVQIRVGTACNSPGGLSPAGSWTFNGMLDDQVGRNSWISLGNIEFTAGRVSDAIRMNGLAGGLEITADPAIDVGRAPGMTVECWFRCEQNRRTTLLAWKSGAGILIYDRRIRMEFSDTAGQRYLLDGPADVPLNQWVHMAVTYDKASGVARIFRDGVMVASGDMGVFTPRTGTDLLLGTGGAYSEAPFFGSIDELSIHASALSESDIASIVSANAAGKCTPRVNQPPFSTASAHREPDGTWRLVGSAIDDGLPVPPGALSYHWEQISGPESADLASPSSASTAVTFPTFGRYGFKLVANDSLLSAESVVSVAVSNIPPSIALVTPADGATLAANFPINLIAQASGVMGPIAKVEFFRGTTNLGETAGELVDQPGHYGITYVPGFPVGSYTLTAKATDSTGGWSTSAPVAISVIATPDVPPSAAIHSTADGDRISAPTPIVGLAHSLTLASWRLEYRLKANAGLPTSTWTTFASGSASIGVPANGLNPAVYDVLGTFDPTLLLNGIYELQLVATDARGVSATDGPIDLIVEGNMKVGAFTLAFEDLSVPVAGIPISVTRTYDSRDSRVGDFGPGWNIAVNNIRVQKNRNLGLGWTQDLGGSELGTYYYVDPLVKHLVSVVFPDGETHRFEAALYVPRDSGPVIPDNAQWLTPIRSGRLVLNPVGDTTSTLEVDGDNAVNLTGYVGEDYLTQGLAGIDPEFNPSRFRLTTQDGTVFILDERLGLLEMHDLIGNSLVLQRDAQQRVTAIVSTQVAGAADEPITRSVAIHRDATGRVDYVEDLEGDSIDYTYDAAGRLATVTDRSLNVTEFRYEDPAFAHYLTRIIDPRGITAIRSEYDEDGRLVKQIDADGRETVFDRGIDSAGRFERIEDRLGHETTYYYDDRGNITLKIDPEGARTTFGYYPDSDRVRFETDHYGNSKSFAYDARGNITVETLGASLSDDPANPTTGYVTRTGYNSRGAPTSLTDPDGRAQSFTYDPASNTLLTHTSAAGTPAASTTTFTYLADGSVDTITDALGILTQHTYDVPFADADYPGAVKRVTITVTDPAGEAGSDPANVTATILRTSHTIYDAAEKALAEIVLRTLPDGTPQEIVTRHRYDADDRLVATILPDGRVQETRYNAIGKEAASVQWQSVADYEAGDDTHARVTSFDYDSRGNQVLVTHPDGSTEATGYDAENRRLWSQDRRGARTFFVFDTVGRLTATILPDDNDGLGATAPTALDDPRLADNSRSTTIYDLIGRVRFQIDEEGATTEFTYEDGCGCAMRRKEMIQHLPAGNLVTSYLYDNAGNVRFVTDPRGHTVETRYDEQGRPTHVIYPATDEHPSTETVTTYDVLGRRVALTDQEGRLTRYRYDGLGRLVEVRQYLDQSLAASDFNFNLPASTDNVVVTTFAYDEAGNQTAQTDALGRTTTYETDTVGRRVKRILPKDAGEATALAEVLDYDAWGQLWQRIDFAGRTTTFEYDVLGRLRAKAADPAHPSLSYSNAAARIEYDYDVVGQREAARTYRADGTLLYSESTPHDIRGRLDYKDTAGGRLDYTTYENGLLKDVVSSNSGGVNIAYRYDALNRLAYVDDTSSGVLRTTSYGYSPNGSLETVSYANGIFHTYQYDALNRLRDLSVRHLSSLIRHQDYRLRASGHRREVVETDARYSLPATRSYQYDALYRLAGETIGGDAHGHDGTVTYALDKVGNRLGRTTTGPSLQPKLPTSTSSFGARDWLDSDTYDANGNTQVGRTVLGEPPGTDVYDFENRLIVRHRTDGTSVNLAYDADGNRIGRTILNSGGALVRWTTYLVDTNNLTGYAQVFEERTTAFGAAGEVIGDFTKSYTYGSDLISVASTVIGSPTTVHRFFSYDGHGSVRELTDETGAVTDRYDYDAFGVLLRHEGTSDNAYLYCGEQWDADLGLYFLRARYLNPDSGRFWNMDTYEGSVGDPITLHKYLYASANPVTFVDPSGHLSLMEVMTAFTVKAILVRMAVGATIGAVDSALSGRNILVGAAWGAGIGAIAPAIPWQIGLPLAGLGIADAALEGDWDTFALRVGVMAIGFGLSSYAQGQVGGRWGSFSTRLQDSRLALWLMRRGFSISNGGGQGAQEYIPPAPGRPSRTFVDITAKRGSTTVRIQTVTVNKNGTPIPEEVAAAARIKHAFPGDELILIAKTEQGVVLLPVADAPGGGASGDSTEE